LRGVPWCGCSISKIHTREAVKVRWRINIHTHTHTHTHTYILARAPTFISHPHTNRMGRGEEAGERERERPGAVKRLLHQQCISLDHASPAVAGWSCLRTPGETPSRGTQTQRDTRACAQRGGGTFSEMLEMHVNCEGQGVSVEHTNACKGTCHVPYCACARPGTPVQLEKMTQMVIMAQMVPRPASPAPPHSPPAFRRRGGACMYAWAEECSMYVYMYACMHNIIAYTTLEGLAPSVGVGTQGDEFCACSNPCKRTDSAQAPGRLALDCDHATPFL
jgi:hypothetical protein